MWLLLASLLALLMVFFEEITRIEVESEVPFAVSIALFPVAIAVAIFRYRLYDIDVIINRALVYGTLTVSLVLVYVGGVAATQTVFRVLAGLVASRTLPGHGRGDHRAVGPPPARAGRGRRLEYRRRRPDLRDLPGVSHRRSPDRLQTAPQPDRLDLPVRRAPLDAPYRGRRIRRLRTRRSRFGPFPCNGLRAYLRVALGAR